MLKKVVARRLRPHAFLFVGPMGVGKFLTACVFGLAVNGISEGKIEFVEDERGFPKPIVTHPDVRVVEPEGMWIKIERIREMRNQAYMSPIVGPFKVFVVRDAHRMRRESANALLKVLEEPPQDTLFVLTSDTPKLLPTILSRVLPVRFGGIPKGELRGKLEEMGVPKDSSEFLADVAGGSLGFALSIWNERIRSACIEFDMILSLLSKGTLPPGWFVFASGRLLDRISDRREWVLFADFLLARARKMAQEGKALEARAFTIAVENFKGRIQAMANVRLSLENLLIELAELMWGDFGGDG